ncbi:MAG: dTDP-4-dehydrorhamnose 3,5-epimerase [Deltaproteobacteria bacterium]|nr:dTDP-4-dehydrorhamnose 3,5-epimerase [Deltaproteobacteria bacterium]
MNVIKTDLPGVVIIDPQVFLDDRGFFVETWHQERYQRHGLPEQFVQDNLSASTRGTLRGLHFQHPSDQAKLVYVLQGAVFDVAVDIRVGSLTFGKWISVVLSDENKQQLYIPEGFAHGFCVTSESALVAYKCTDFYNPTADNGVLWNDPDLGINWPTQTPILSPKDSARLPLKAIPAQRLPKYQ